MDMSPFVAPKSNQLNADDLLAGPRTITITGVRASGNAEQPVAVSFDGDDGKPYLPCKSMRRVMIAAWGVNAAGYVGRSMTLYRDPKVMFGGMEVGGIRISHMSHLERDLALALTVTKSKRAPFVVKPLAAPRAAPAAPSGGDGAVYTALRPDGAPWRTASPDKWAEACKRAIAKIEPDGAAALVRWRDAMEAHIAAVPPPHGEEVAAALSDALDAAAEREAIQAEGAP